jgi:hypothetical protein
MSETPYVKIGVLLRDRIRELSDTDLRVLLALGLRINNERQCWPAMSDIAAECGRTECMVQYSIKNLIDNGFLHVGRRVGGRGKANVYTLNGYFAYGAETVQLISPFMADSEVQKGEISNKKGEMGRHKKVKSQTPIVRPTKLRPARDITGKKNHKEEPVQEEPVQAQAPAFRDWKERLRVGNNAVGVLVDAFRALHPDAPEDDLKDPGGRLGAIMKTCSGDAGYVLKLIWDSSSGSIAGSHLNYIQGQIRREHGTRRGYNQSRVPKRYTDPRDY